MVHAWALRVGDDAAAQHAASYRGRPGGLFDERSSLPRAVGLLSGSWADAPAVAPPLVGRSVFPSTGVAVARSVPGSARGLTVSVKGGHNDANHNHVDIGSVIVALDGVPVDVAAGKPTYRAGTFGPDRYDLWVVRGDWHNVPRVRGVEQAPGAEYGASSFEVLDAAAAAAAPAVGQGAERRGGRSLSADKATNPTFDAPVDGGTAAGWRARVEMGGAYPVGELVEWWREVALEPAAETVTVVDSWTFSPAATNDPDGPTAWHWLLAGDVVLTPGRAVARFAPDDAPDDAADAAPDTPPGRSLAITWDPAAVDAALDVRALDDPELSAVWGEHLTRLRLTARSEAPSGSFQVTMRPIGSGMQEDA